MTDKVDGEIKSRGHLANVGSSLIILTCIQAGLCALNILWISLIRKLVSYNKVFKCHYLQNVTLLELMDEDDVVQECKSQNKKLVDL